MTFRLFISLIVLWVGATGFCEERVRPKLILDADTANEIDDMYSIVRMLRQDHFDVLGVSSAQWFHYLGDPNSVQASQKINESLASLLGRTDLSLPLGADRPVGKPWGGTDARDSAAAQFIIQHAKSLPDGQQLHVVCLGASTNLASAIKLAPEIAPKIKAYLMGFRYDAAKRVWNKSEFNVRRDLNAADLLLDQPDLELHIMSADVSGELKFDRDETFRRQQTMGDLGEFLTSQWKTKFASSKTWVMWDLAVVEALLRPELASERQVDTPPENTPRKVWVYDHIDVKKMSDDYWRVALEGG
ncbi:nucleoside hydrolase [Stieleria marina]|uniref:Ribonucleoside hydrolase RihC n=1 Tax=Stieleria marina TaxID=1930275 RepID=A0A517NS37_9BACT|nr:ribonucleoside hydrolase RihC [Planctomycetes bacterium K23_9]